MIFIPFKAALFAQQGKVDITFNTFDDGLTGDGFDSPVQSLVLQPDGNLIVGGEYLTLNGIPAAYLTRLKPDGSIDETFNTGAGFNGKVYTVFLQPDGRILVGGSFTMFDGKNTGGLVRLNPDGSYDSSFSTIVGVATGAIYDIALQLDGKIVIVGSFLKYNGITVNRIARLLTNGTLDNSFITGLGFSHATRSVKPLADGKIIIGGDFTSFNGITSNRIVKLNINGTVDTGFFIGTAFNDDVNDIQIQNDGKIVIGGNFTKFNEAEANRIIRLNPDGTRDNLFSSGSGFSKEGVKTIKIDNAGNIMAGGSFIGFYNDFNVNRVAFLNPDGTLKTEFDIGNGPSGASVFALETDAEGSWFIGGSFSAFDGLNQGKLAKVSSEGEHDIAYLAAGVGFDNSVLSILPLENKKIIVVGSFKKFNGAAANRITCLQEDGSSDSEFNKSKSGADNIVKSAVIQNDGKIILTGNFVKYNDVQVNRIVRILPDGSLDDTFLISKGFNSQVNAIQLQTDGRLIAAGKFASYNGMAAGKIVRLLSDGSRDSSFNTGIGADGDIEIILIQPDGKILVGGRFDYFNGLPYGKLVRLNLDGSIDTSFNIGFGFDKNVFALAIQNDGKILVGGSFVNYNKKAQKRIVRLNTDGSFDSTFDSGMGFSKGDVRTILVQPDNKIIIGGTFSGTYNSNSSLRLIRVLDNGNYDNTFSAPLNNKLFSMCVGADSKLLIGGNFNSVSGISKHRIARLKICLDTTIWNGQFWSKGFPSSGKEVIFREDFPNLSSVNVCSCTIENQKTVTLLSGNNLGIEFSYKGSGNLILEDAAALYQNDDDIINTGIVTLKRKTQPVLKFDFTYWSSPVSDQKLFDLSPKTLGDKYYSYNDVLENWKIEKPSNAMLVGKGYGIRAPQDYSTTNRTIFEGVFKGIPNNGKVEINITLPQNYALIGNPYPSAVDADAFLKKNSPKINGALYFWTHNSPLSSDVAGDAKYNYSSDDYAVYNILGGTATRPALSSGINESEPDGTIASGQAFFVKSNIASRIEFNDNMRISGRNGAFFKPSQSKETSSENKEQKHRAWINLESKEGIFKQILVGYTADARNSLDLLYDAEYMSGNSIVDFYSIADQKKLVIQGRIFPLVENDSINIGFKSAVNGNFTLKIDHQDGFFNNTNVYLEDLDLKILHNLSKEPYNFSSNIGTFDHRFVLRFSDKKLLLQKNALHNQDVIVFVKNHIINIESVNDNIREVVVFDISGKQIFKTKIKNSKTTKLQNVSSSHQILLVKTILENDSTVISKIIF